MDSFRGENGVKQKILKDVARCVKTIFARLSTEPTTSITLSLDCPLITSIDNVLHYGILSPGQGYWPLVSCCSHLQTLQAVDQWIGTGVPVRLRGQAWLVTTLIEGSLQSYLQCMIADSQTINLVYAPHAVMQDMACVSQFCSLLRGLESISFQLAEVHESTEEKSPFQGTRNVLGINKSSLQLALDSTSSATASSIMTSSMTSSLASPEDSGFTQLDSETDTASFSEIFLEKDCTSVKEFANHLIHDPSVQTSMCLHQRMELMTASDIANGNTSPVVDPKAESDDEIVYRRPKHNKRKVLSGQQKRVSFHECIPMPWDETGASESSIPKLANEAYTPKLAQTLLDSFKIHSTSLSFAVHGMPTLTHELDGVEIGKDTSILCGNTSSSDFSHDESSVLYTKMPNLLQFCHSNDSGSTIEAKKAILSITSSCETVCKVPEERGAPEGQEDPPQKCRQHLSSIVCSGSEFSSEACDSLNDRRPISPIPSCSSLKAQFSSPRHTPSRSTNCTSSGVSNKSSVLNQTPSKACLVKRFLRSVTEKKLSNHRLAAALSAAEKKMGKIKKVNLYISGVTPNQKLSQEVLDELDEEIHKYHSGVVEHKHSPTLDVHKDPTSYVHLLPSTETIFKIINMQSSSSHENGKRAMLYAVVTDEALHVFNNHFNIENCLPLDHITSALISPSSQWIMLRSVDGFSVVFVLCETGGAASLISSIEFMLRKRRKLSTLPSIYQITMEEFTPWRSLLQGEHVHHFSIVHAVEDIVIPPSASLAPTKKAHFMYRINSAGRTVLWEPGFFILKDSILYVFSDEGKSATPLMFNLRGVYASLTQIASRPHIIEIGSLQIAAPDNCVACDWLQSLQMSSAGVTLQNEDKAKSHFVSCSLLLTDSRLLLLPFNGIEWNPDCKVPQPLLSGYLLDVSSLSVGKGVSCWCVVELSCREVQQSGGDYIVFFNSHGDSLSFLENIWNIKPSIKKVTHVLSEDNPLRHQCEKLASILLGWLP